MHTIFDYHYPIITRIYLIISLLLFIFYFNKSDIYLIWHSYILIGWSPPTLFPSGVTTNHTFVIGIGSSQKYNTEPAGDKINYLRGVLFKRLIAIK